MQFASSWDTEVQRITPEHEASDATLVARATSDDGAARVAAFGVLYSRYVERIYAYVRSRTINREDAADLTQQVFLQALAALPRYQQGSTPFVAWLFRIARNCAASFHRRTQTTISWDALPIECRPEEADDPIARTILAREDRAYLHALLESLPIETREMLALRFAADLSASEIAAVLGKREGAVKKRLARAMQILKERSNAIAR